MEGGGVALVDVDMFAEEIASGRLVAPYDVVFEEGYGYYLKLHVEDLADPVVSLFRSWLIGRFQAFAKRDARERRPVVTGPAPRATAPSP